MKAQSNKINTNRSLSQKKSKQNTLSVSKKQKQQQQIHFQSKVSTPKSPASIRNIQPSFQNKNINTKNATLNQDHIKELLNSSKSYKNLNYLSEKSIKKNKKQNIHHIEQIQKQYTKQTFIRSQHKKNICQKINQILNQIKERQTKLKSFFEIYQILQKQAGQQRCLQHNNDLSLYCQTQGKILCVHCVYFNNQSSLKSNQHITNKHKTHKVIPLIDSIKNITEDIVNMQFSISLQLQSIKAKVKITQQNQTKIQKLYNSELADIQEKFNIELHRMQSQYLNKKKQTSQYFQEVITQNKKLLGKLQVLQRQIIDKLGYLKANVKNSPHKKKGQLSILNDIKQISRHTMLSKLSEICDMQNVTIDKIQQKDLLLGYNGSLRISNNKSANRLRSNSARKSSTQIKNGQK